MKASNELQELIILALIVFFLFQCVFTDNVYNAGHELFTKIGIADEIQGLDKMFRGE